MCMGGNAPDYKGAAEAESKGNVDLINAQTTANRPTLKTPWGTMDWENNNGDWTGTVSLAPDQQAALDQQMKLGARRSEMAGTLMDQVGKNFASPLDLSGLPGTPDANAVREQSIGAAYDQMKSRLDPMWAERERSFRAGALAEGGDPRSDPYGVAAGNMGRDRNDAYQTAFNNAIITGGNQAAQTFDMGLKGRQQALAELLQQRTQPFNEMQSLLGGQQVGMPQFPGFNSAGVAKGPEYLAAANMQGQYGLQQNQIMADLIGAGMGAAGNAAAFGFG